jgi:hypothetical protein
VLSYGVTMFGPLNGVRVVLVATASLAAVVAFFIGQVMVGILLLIGIIAHGLGWLYLYRQRSGRS